MKERSALAGSLIAGFLASVCCIGPLVLGAVGLGSLGFAAALAPLRPWFLGLTGFLIAIGFFLAYRPQRPKACAPGEACAEPGGRRIQRIALWTVTVLAVGLATYPSWASRVTASRVTASRGAATPTKGTALVVLNVEGMTCSGCEAEIERELARVNGVVDATVSYEEKRADVRVAGNTPRADLLIAAIEQAAYHASVERGR